MARKLLILASLAFALVSGPALAQTAPSRVVPPSRPDQTPPPSSARQPAPPRPPGAAAAPQVQPFVLTSVTVEGSTLPPGVLAAAYQPFLGQTVDAAGLQRLSDAIAKVYEKSDVALYTVLIPEQDLQAGRLRIVALEGYVEDVAIEGAQSRRHRTLTERQLGALKDQKPLKKRDFQRKVSLVRDTPGQRTDIQLLSGTQPGAVRIAAKIDPKPFQAGIGINNRGTSYLGRTQVQADLYANSLFRQGDQTRLTYATPTETRLFQYYAGAHSQPLNADGTTLSVNAGRLRTRPKDTGLRGRATSAGIQVSHPVIRSYDQDLWLTVGLDGLDSDNAFLGVTFSDDRTRAIRASAAYSRTTAKSLFAASGAVSRGLDALGARTVQPDAGKLEFLKVNGRLTYNRSLAAPVILRLSGTGQYSGDRLPAAEHFALGGEEFGRGYEASFLAGDYGYAGSAELAYRPDLPDRLSGSEVYGYVDGGKIWYRGRFGFPTARATLSSAGGGVRMVWDQRALVQLEAAKGLENPFPLVDRDDWRGVFNVRTVF